MIEGTDSPNDRMALRRTRRWRRRARIVVPFLTVPVILGLLVLSVDLIEYQPASRADRPNEPPRAAAPATPTAPSLGGGAIGLGHEAALCVSVIEAPLSATPSSSAPGIPAAWPGEPLRP